MASPLLVALSEVLPDFPDTELWCLRAMCGERVQKGVTGESGGVEKETWARAGVQCGARDADKGFGAGGEESLFAGGGGTGPASGVDTCGEGNPCPPSPPGAEESSEGTALGAQGCSGGSCHRMHPFSQKTGVQAAIGHLPRERETSTRAKH